MYVNDFHRASNCHGQTAEYHEYCVHGLFHVRGKTEIHEISWPNNKEETTLSVTDGDMRKKKRNLEDM